MFSQSNSPFRRQSRNARLFFCIATICATFIIIIICNESFLNKRPAMAFFQSLRSQNRPKEKSNYLRYTHLQPLKELFANLTKESQRNLNGNKTDCMFSVQGLSDLEEIENKRDVFLLIIVSSAPSWSGRRAAIRDTWWKHCHGKVSLY